MVLAGTELVQARIMLWFGFFFLMRLVVITPQCVSCCRAVPTQSQGLSSSSCCEEAGGVHSQDRWPRLARDVPCRRASCSLIKPGVKKEEGGCSVFCLPKKPLCVMCPDLLGVAETLPAGKQQTNSWFGSACARIFCFTQ